jgi:uncharacterized protein YndB with AHSA1/START domain
VEAHEIDSAPDRLVVSVELPGLEPREALQHWLQPELLTRWWPAEAENDARIGGWYHIWWPVQGWHLRGRYTILDPDRALGFTWQWDHEPEQPLRHVAVDVTPRAEGGTVMTVTHAVYGDSAAEQGVRDEHREGWLHFLGRLASLGVVPTDVVGTCRRRQA